MSAHPLTELGIRIESSPCRRAADPELCELGPPGMQTSRRAADPLGPAGELLAEGDRHRILQMCAPRLDAVRVSRGLLVDGLRELVEMAAERLRQLERREAHRGRRGVVRGLAHVHVVVGVHVLVRPETAAEDLVGAVGQNLVDVHVERDARAGMEDVDDELVDMLPGEDLIARRDDPVFQFRIESSRLGVRERCRSLDANERSDERWKGPIAADRIVLDRSLGLGSPERVGGDLYLA